MCGFSAVFYLNGSAPPEVINADLEKSLKYLAHRGPDSHGIYVHPSGTLGLGHVRLSIIDLDSSQQPLSDEDDKIWCIVTGEFYDFEKQREELISQGAKFKTKGDSELLVQLYKRYGLNAVLQLRGEFAFILWDDKRKHLFVGRDRFGIKPLYFVQSGEKLLIASEIKAFIPMGWTPEWDVESIMALGQYHDDRTNFRGVEKLRPGHYMIAKKHSPIDIRPYWDLSYRYANQPETRTVDEMILGVRERLIESVRLRLRADVPLGIYLSGGLDSSCLAGIASHILREKDPNARVTAFTLSFPGEEEDAKYDEGPIAQRTADFVNADMKILKPTEEDLIHAFEGCIWHSELALSDLGGAAKHLLSGLVQREGYRVVLTGEGADEIAAGYPMFLGDYLRAPDHASANLGIELPTDEERETILRKLESNPLDMGMTAMSYDDSKVARAMLGGISAHRHFAVATPPPSIFNEKAQKSVGEVDGALTIAENINGIVRQHAVDGSWHPLHVALYAEGKSTLPNSLLNQLGDRNEMAHSIEGRLPFLDHKLAEYLNGLPPSVKLRPIKGEDGEWKFTEKWVLREAVKPFITDELYTRMKQMFTAPLKKTSSNEAITETEDKEDEKSKKKPQPIIDMLTSQLTEENIDSLGFISYKEIDKQFKQYLSGDWEAGYGGLPRCLRICLLVYSLLILKQRFGVKKWYPDSGET